MVETLRIGLIVKPQGVRGELKIQPLTDDINRFRKLKSVIIDEKTYPVTKVTVGGGVVFLSILGVNDRDQAETYRGKFISVDRENAVPLKKDNFFIVDILGCQIITDLDEKIGEVIDVSSSRTDVFTVKCVDGKIMRFPFLKDLLVSVDVASKKIVVKAKRLSEVSCYED